MPTKSFQGDSYALICHTSRIPASTDGSVAAVTAAFATAATLTGGTKPAPNSGTPARDFVGRTPRTLSSG